MTQRAALDVGMTVRVYFNLHKRQYSVMCWEAGHSMKGRVIAHLDDVSLENCTFVVQPAGRAKVLKTRANNVHAFVQGRWAEKSLDDVPAQPVHYNPYSAPWFTVGGTRQSGARRVEGAVINRRPSMVSLG